MSEQQQPECPAEFAWMRPGAFADYREYQIVQIMELPAIEQGEWRVRCYYTTDTFGYLPCADLEMYGGDSEFNHVCARLAEAEARVKELEAEKAQEHLRAVSLEMQLHDQAGRWAVDALQLDTARQSLADTKALSDGFCNQMLLEVQKRTEAEEKISQVKSLLDGVGPAMTDMKTLLDFSDPEYSLLFKLRSEHLPALLSAISEVREVLKGE